MSIATPSEVKPHRVTEHPPFECITLLLQGGGALGSYQAGVYQALAAPDVQAKKRQHHLFGVGALEGGLGAQSALCHGQARSDSAPRKLSPKKGPHTESGPT